MDTKTRAAISLALAGLNLSLAVAFPDIWMSPINYGIALFGFGAAMLIAIEGRK